MPYYLSLLAGLEARSGALPDALGTLDEALRISTSNGDSWWNAEVHRMRGTVLHELGDRDEEACAAVRHALSIARDQGASMLERRARESLEALGSNAPP